MNIRFELSQDFINIPAYVVEINFGIEEDAVGVDDKRAAERKTRFFIVHAEHAGNLSSGVRAHGVLHIFQQFFVLLPGEVNELGVGADGDNFGIKLLELPVLLCQSSEFGGSDESEIGGVKEQDRPFFRRFLYFETYFPEIALCGFVSFEFEIRYFLVDLHTAHCFGHGKTSLSRMALI